MITHEEQKAMQRRSMEKQRFGYTREEILAKKGAKCASPKSDHAGDLVIDHIDGGGRHASERGMVIPGKTHDMSNFQVLCRKHAGERDALRQSRGLGMPGNPNNQS